MREGLFREEVLDARRESWLGRVHLPATRLGWPMAALGAAGALALALLLGLGSYQRKERVQGQIVPAGGLHTLAAPAAGTVSRLLVAEGARVAAGQPLLELRVDVEGAGGGGAVATQVAAALARQRGELRGELDDLAAAAPAEARALRERIAVLERQLASAAEEVDLRTRQSEAAQRMLERIRPLQEQRIVSAVQTQQYEDQALAAEALRETAERNRLETGDRLAEARRALQDRPMRERERRSALTQALAEVSREDALNQAQGALLLRAQAGGEVSGVAVDAGQSVRAGQRLLAVLPAGAEFRAELWIPARAAGTVAPGDRVSMRYHAFPYQVFGRQSGRILEIGRSAVPAEDVRARSGLDPGGPAYRALVALDAQQVRRDGRALPLRTHMTLDADLLLERRPLYRALFADDGGRGAAEPAPR
ncbi:HlyD family secretion protein [Luteimonas sp. Y-2-2-4F]|nr:HlyD family efflux transporter periplasmic adaptor subunit [Luteimonas sp. Y-2-2-4F]MCD9030898.1 HlyD family secretion protein [Luteimonas sp. Y-2-2-4F]